VGADELSPFVLSGFRSLQALSDELCKPFDAARTGINLGEAASAVLITSDPKSLGVNSSIRILGSGLSNDANHISGPSRTGEELSHAIDLAIAESNLSPDEIDFISGHGTATLYNDEMEAKALSLSNLSDVPVHSLKGYYGHTLGAAGVVESVIGFESLRKNVIVSTLGHENLGVSKKINVTTENIKKPVRTFLKTASGFGGCNAAIVFQKN
jgi:3-oxoacyl-[acyl-carrier-protein] synthase-1